MMSAKSVDNEVCYSEATDKNYSESATLIDAKKGQKRKSDEPCHILSSEKRSMNDLRCNTTNPDLIDLTDSPQSIVCLSSRESSLDRMDLVDSPEPEESAVQVMCNREQSEKWKDKDSLHEDYNNRSTVSTISLYSNMHSDSNIDALKSRSIQYAQYMQGLMSFSQNTASTIVDFTGPSFAAETTYFTNNMTGNQPVYNNYHCNSRQMPVEAEGAAAYDVAHFTSKHAWLRNRKWAYSEVKSRLLHLKKPYTTFTIGSYNVLSQDLLTNNAHLYHKCRQAHLSWDFRRRNLLQEITALHPDILCLQEVYYLHFKKFFKPELNKLGYDGVFKQRTGTMKDGCATFWKTSIFALEKAVPVEYLKRGIRVLDRDNVALLVLLKIKVSDVSNDDLKLCISNTHLLFNPKRGDVKLAQAMLLMAEIDQLAYNAKGSCPRSYFPTIVCGDFNSVPFSHLYNFLCYGYLAYQGLEENKISGQADSWTSRPYVLQNEIVPKKMHVSDNCQYFHKTKKRLKDYSFKHKAKIKTTIDHQGQQVFSDDDHNNAVARQELKESKDSGSPENVDQTEGDLVSTYSDEVKQCSGTLSHNFDLCSVYKHSNEKGEMEVSTHHGKASCTVDYIFYSVNSSNISKDKHSPACSCIADGQLKLLGKLVLPTTADTQALGSLPNELVSSDHLILMAKFAFCAE